MMFLKSSSKSSSSSDLSSATIKFLKKNSEKSGGTPTSDVSQPLAFESTSSSPQSDQKSIDSDSLRYRTKNSSRSPVPSRNTTNAQDPSVITNPNSNLHPTTQPKQNNIKTAQPNVVSSAQPMYTRQSIPNALPNQFASTAQHNALNQQTIFSSSGNLVNQQTPLVTLTPTNSHGNLVSLAGSHSQRSLVSIPSQNSVVSLANNSSNNPLVLANASSNNSVVLANAASNNSVSLQNNLISLQNQNRNQPFLKNQVSTRSQNQTVLPHRNHPQNVLNNRNTQRNQNFHQKVLQPMQQLSLSRPNRMTNKRLNWSEKNQTGSGQNGGHEPKRDMSIFFYYTGSVTTWVCQENMSSCQIIRRTDIFTNELCSRWFNELKKLNIWNEIYPKDHGCDHTATGKREHPRLTSWLCQCKCRYYYSGSIAQPRAYPPIVKEIESKIMPLLSVKSPPNSCFLNQYRDGRDCVGWHADDEDMFDSRKQTVTVVTFSLGETRHFQVRKKGEPNLRPWSFMLQQGDICVMSGWFQQYYEHRVPPAHCDKSRISLTFRWVQNHQPHCKQARQ